MEPGKIRLINRGEGGTEADFTQTIAVSVGNRVYRLTNNGAANGAPATMTIRITRTVFFFTVRSTVELTAGRSVDVFGSSITVTVLDALQLFGTYDACC
jgi:hypothetical protein